MNFNLKESLESLGLKRIEWEQTRETSVEIVPNPDKEPIKAQTMRSPRQERNLGKIENNCTQIASVIASRRNARAFFPFSSLHA